MEFFFEPIPEMEMGVEEDIKTKLQKYEKRYLIRHLVRGKKVGFHFVLASNTDVKMKPYSKDETGEVEFIPRSISRSLDQKSQIAKFITLYLIFLLLPSAVSIIPFFGSTVAGIVEIVILIYIFPFIKPFAEVIADMISIFVNEKKVQITAHDIKSDGDITIVTNK